MSIKYAIIDPRFIISYGSYYIYGLALTIGWRNIYFKVIDNLSVADVEDYRKGLAVAIVTSQNKIKNIFIDTNDSSNIHSQYYEWADVYAKINISKSDLGLYPKALAIGPSFGIKLWSPIKTVIYAIRNYLKARKGCSFPIPFRTYLRDYCYMFVRRLSYNKYISDYTEDNEYVFSLDTLWYDDVTDKTTNYYRGIFKRKAKEIFSSFEGGFYFIGNNISSQFPKYGNYLSLYKGLIYTKRISPHEYIKNTKKKLNIF